MLHLIVECNSYDKTVVTQTAITQSAWAVE